MKSLTCDVLVIGGGATGVCTAYDLARRGLSVILADMNDLTTGTSGRYHGLLHSGARYAVRDEESAQECIDENRILRHIVPHVVEDTGGLFVAAAHDPADYVQPWVEACAAVGIDTEELTIAEARKQEPALRDDLARVFRVPDGSVDGFDLGHAFTQAAESYGAKTLVYHKVTGLEYTSGGVRATLEDERAEETVQLEARWVVNAAGPWAGQVASLAGHDVTIRWSRGVMVAMNTRWVNTVVNRLRPPDDGDILVPVGTVSVIGTTSVAVDDPGDNRIEAWEISKMLDEGDAIITGFRQARALRAWAGVRPLYEPPGDHADASGRTVKRTFSVVRHAPGLTSVVGGKLTTARLMAEKAADDVCAGLGIDVPCTTANELLPAMPSRRLHALGHRLDELEHGKMPGQLICECEMVTRPQLEEAIASYDAPPALDDLRRDLRLGMGPCQGGFCAARAAGIMQDVRDLSASESIEALQIFIDERYKGSRPLLWGQHLRQWLLDELLYRQVIGLGDQPSNHITALPAWVQDQSPLPTVDGKRIVVVGAGLTGLMAAVHAVRSGAKVTLVTDGLGRLHLTSGRHHVGPFVDHPGVESFKQWTADFADLRLAGDKQGAFPTMFGVPRQADFVPETMASGALDGAGNMLIVGFAGWRDFYPKLCAASLNEQGYTARGIHVDLPFMAKGWDQSPTELAHKFDDKPFCEEIARLVRGRLRGETSVGFPAVLGLRNRDVVQHMAELIGLPVFEIPTLTPSVPGTRLFNTFKRWLLQHGARVQIGHEVKELITVGDKAMMGVVVASAGRDTLLYADAVILATGGLYGGGLRSDDHGRVWEPIADLPVMANNDRTQWFNSELLTAEAHPVVDFGVAVDQAMRPVKDGTPIYANLFAAGHLLGGVSGLARQSAEGLALASAYAAVRAALHEIS